MELLTPSAEISESYFEALEKGYVDKSRGKKATIKDIPAIKNDFTAFVSSFDDLEPTADLMTLSNGEKVKRLPSITRWIWDEGFSGAISFRWQKGTTDLPYYCLGHIGYEVVEWKRNQGLATLALKSMCEIAKKMDMSFVEVVTDIDNAKSQRVILKSNGVLIELFVKPKHFGQTLSIRYRIYL
jgi:predicted acetyltransferase